MNKLTKTEIIALILWAFTYSYVGTSLGIKKDIYYLFIGGFIFFGGAFLICYIIRTLKKDKTKE
ncbi:hypothetical protein ACFQZ1_05865 [Bacillus sp. CGMCC 1.60114]|uniref:hypothetical protein n=1 Tax=unclassified Bacillus (in: firmicutes) TaxID=185979 RepID=UPI0036288307